MGIKETFDEFIKGLEEKERTGKPREENIPQSTLESISRMQLVEFQKRDMALEVYSEILECTIWLCSNEGMAAQVRRDDPQAVTYTVDEIRHLLRLQVSPEELKRIHDAKSIFKDSKVINSNLKNGEGK